MKKNHFRDYATEAFRFYARVGGAKAYKQKIFNTALDAQLEKDEFGAGVSKPTEAAIAMAYKAVEEAKADIADLDAVEFVIGLLEQKASGKSRIDALTIVYMTEPDKPIKRGDITDRIYKASRDTFNGVDVIYKWLAEARKEFAEYRGLRI